MRQLWAWPAPPAGTLAGIDTSRAARRTKPKPRTPRARLRTALTHVRLPRTVQLCVHCRQNPAGFWVSRKDAQVVRRPWCLLCCQEAELSSCDVTPFAH